VAYCTSTDLETAMGPTELTRVSDVQKIGNRDAAVITDAIADADAWIDSFVAKQRAVPLATVPRVIKRISVQESIFILKGRRQGATDRERDQHDENERWLEMLAAGKVTLGVDPQPAASALVAPDVVLVEEDDRESTAESLEGFW